MLKGLVLAAGYGSRLRPLTDNRPKPLFPFAGPTLLDLAINKLQQGKVSKLAVNTHYLADQIAAHLKGYDFYKNINISHEKNILGTGGAIDPLREWLGNDHLLIYNADIISDIDINALITQHFKDRNNLSTMVLLPSAMPGKNPVSCYDQKIVGIGTLKNNPVTPYTQHTFTGVHIISPEFVKFIPENQTWHIIDTYNEIIKKGLRVSSFIHNGFWHDMGTPQTYWEALTDFVQNYSTDLDKAMGISECGKKLGKEFEIKPNNGNGPYSLTPRNFILPTGTVLSSSVVIMGNATIGRNVTLNDCLLFDDATINDNEKISNSIVTRHTTIPIVPVK